MFLLSGLGAFQFSYGRTQNELEIAIAFVFLAFGLVVLLSNGDTKIRLDDAKVEVKASSK